MLAFSTIFYYNVDINRIENHLLERKGLGFITIEKDKDIILLLDDVFASIDQKRINKIIINRMFNIFVAEL